MSIGIYGTKEILDDLSEEFGTDIKMEGTIEYDPVTEEYYQVVLGEEGYERFDIPEKYYPIIGRYIY